MKTAKFFIHPEKRKVVCVIENCSYDFLNFICEKTRMDYPINNKVDVIKANTLENFPFAKGLL